MTISEKKWRKIFRSMGYTKKRSREMAAARVDRPSFTREPEWTRAEELRPDRLGPAEEDLNVADETQDDPWRPARTIGPSPKI